MDKNFYGFQGMPFSLTGVCDPDSVYLSQNYTMLLPVLVSRLDRKAALTVVLGENGVGKTTLINYIYEHFQKNFTTGLVCAQSGTSKELIGKVLVSFQQNVNSTDLHEMLSQLTLFLKNKFTEKGGQSTLLIVDDADNMAADAFKGVELLLGLNTEDSQVLQLILVGQPKLEKLLDELSLDELSLDESFLSKQAQCFVEAMSEEETQLYINHKIELVGVKNSKLIDEQACSVIFEYSKGIPAEINTICHDILLYGSKQQKQEISSELIHKVVNGQTEIAEKNGTRSIPSLALIAGLAVGVSLVFLLLPNKPIEPVKEPQKKLSSRLQRSPVIDKPKVQVHKPEKLHQQTENLVEEQAVIDEAVINKAEQDKLLATIAIEAKLAVAEQQIANLKYTSPEGDNAYQTYIAILNISPDEARAINGLQDITNYYLEQAKKQQTSGFFDKSQLSVSKGLKVSPNHQGLIALKTRLAADAKRTKRQKKINALLKQAEQQIDALKFTKPFNDNAYKTYQDIVNFDKNNLQAKQGIRKIFSRLKRRTQRAFTNEKYAVALGRSKEILVLPSKGVADPFHQQANSAAIEIKKIIDKTLERLLRIAKKQQKALQLTRPFGDNAFASYYKVLQIDPDNEEALKGLHSLEMQYEELAKADLSVGKTSQALMTIKEGLKAFPNNQELLLLQSKVLAQPEEADKETEKLVIDKKVEEADKKMRSFGTF